MGGRPVCRTAARRVKRMRKGATWTRLHSSSNSLRPSRWRDIPKERPRVTGHGGALARRRHGKHYPQHRVSPAEKHRLYLRSCRPVPAPPPTPAPSATAAPPVKPTPPVTTAHPSKRRNDCKKTASARCRRRRQSRRTASWPSRFAVWAQHHPAAARRTRMQSHHVSPGRVPITCVAVTSLVGPRVGVDSAIAPGAYGRTPASLSPPAPPPSVAPSPVTLPPLSRHRERGGGGNKGGADAASTPVPAAAPADGAPPAASGRAGATQIPGEGAVPIPGSPVAADVDAHMDVGIRAAPIQRAYVSVGAHSRTWNLSLGAPRQEQDAMSHAASAAFFACASGELSIAVLADVQTAAHDALGNDVRTCVRNAVAVSCSGGEFDLSSLLAAVCPQSMASSKLHVTDFMVDLGEIHAFSRTSDGNFVDRGVVRVSVPKPARRTAMQPGDVFLRMAESGHSEINNTCTVEMSVVVCCSTPSLEAHADKLLYVARLMDMAPADAEPTTGENQHVNLDVLRSLVVALGEPEPVHAQPVPCTFSHFNMLDSTRLPNPSVLQYMAGMPTSSFRVYAFSNVLSAVAIPEPQSLQPVAPVYEPDEDVEATSTAAPAPAAVASNDGDDAIPASRQFSAVSRDTAIFARNYEHMLLMQAASATDALTEGVQSLGLHHHLQAVLRAYTRLNPLVSAVLQAQVAYVVNQVHAPGGAYTSAGVASAVDTLETLKLAVFPGNQQDMTSSIKLIIIALLEAVNSQGGMDFRSYRKAGKDALIQRLVAQMVTAARTAHPEPAGTSPVRFERKDKHRVPPETPCAAGAAEDVHELATGIKTVFANFHLSGADASEEHWLPSIQSSLAVLAPYIPSHVAEPSPVLPLDDTAAPAVSTSESSTSSLPAPTLSPMQRVRVFDALITLMARNMAQNFVQNVEQTALQARAQAVPELLTALVMSHVHFTKLPVHAAGDTTDDETSADAAPTGRRKLQSVRVSTREAAYKLCSRSVFKHAVEDLMPILQAARESDQRATNSNDEDGDDGNEDENAAYVPPDAAANPVVAAIAEDVRDADDAMSPTLKSKLGTAIGKQRAATIFKTLGSALELVTRLVKCLAVESVQRSVRAGCASTNTAWVTSLDAFKEACTKDQHADAHVTAVRALHPQHLAEALLCPIGFNAEFPAMTLATTRVQRSTPRVDYSALEGVLEGAATARSSSAAPRLQQGSNLYDADVHSPYVTSPAPDAASTVTVAAAPRGRQRNSHGNRAVVRAASVHGSSVASSRPAADVTSHPRAAGKRPRSAVGAASSTSMAGSIAVQAATEEEDASTALPARPRKRRMSDTTASALWAGSGAAVQQPPAAPPTSDSLEAPSADVHASHHTAGLSLGLPRKRSASERAQSGRSQRKKPRSSPSTADGDTDMDVIDADDDAHLPHGSSTIGFSSDDPALVQRTRPGSSLTSHIHMRSRQLERGGNSTEPVPAPAAVNRLSSASTLAPLVSPSVEAAHSSAAYASIAHVSAPPTLDAGGGEVSVSSAPLQSARPPLQGRSRSAGPATSTTSSRNRMRTAPSVGATAAPAHLPDIGEGVRTARSTGFTPYASVMFIESARMLTDALTANSAAAAIVAEKDKKRAKRDAADVSAATSSGTSSTTPVHVLPSTTISTSTAAAAPVAARQLEGSKALRLKRKRRRHISGRNASAAERRTAARSALCAVAAGVDTLPAATLSESSSSRGSAADAAAASSSASLPIVFTMATLLSLAEAVAQCMLRALPRNGGPVPAAIATDAALIMRPLQRLRDALAAANRGEACFERVRHRLLQLLAAVANDISARGDHIRAILLHAPKQCVTPVGPAASASRARVRVGSGSMARPVDAAQHALARARILQSLLAAAKGLTLYSDAAGLTPAGVKQAHAEMAKLIAWSVIHRSGAALPTGDITVRPFTPSPVEYDAMAASILAVAGVSEATQRVRDGSFSTRELVAILQAARKQEQPCNSDSDSAPAASVAHPLADAAVSDSPPSSASSPMSLRQTLRAAGAAAPLLRVTKGETNHEQQVKNFMPSSTRRNAIRSPSTARAAPPAAPAPASTGAPTIATSSRKASASAATVPRIPGAKVAKASPSTENVPCATPTSSLIVRERCASMPTSQPRAIATVHLTADDMIAAVQACTLDFDSVRYNCKGGAITETVLQAAHVLLVSTGIPSGIAPSMAFNGGKQRHGTTDVLAAAKAFMTGGQRYKALVANGMLGMHAAAYCCSSKTFRLWVWAYYDELATQVFAPGSDTDSVARRARGGHLARQLWLRALLCATFSADTLQSCVSGPRSDGKAADGSRADHAAAAAERRKQGRVLSPFAPAFDEPPREHVHLYVALSMDQYRLATRTPHQWARHLRSHDYQKPERKLLLPVRLREACAEPLAEKVKALVAASYKDPFTLSRTHDGRDSLQMDAHIQHTLLDGQVEEDMCIKLAGVIRSVLQERPSVPPPGAAHVLQADVSASPPSLYSPIALGGSFGHVLGNDACLRRLQVEVGEGAAAHMSTSRMPAGSGRELTFLLSSPDDAKARARVLDIATRMQAVASTDRVSMSSFEAPAAWRIHDASSALVKDNVTLGVSHHTCHTFSVALPTVAAATTSEAVGEDVADNMDVDVPLDDPAVVSAATGLVHIVVRILVADSPLEVLACSATDRCTMDSFITMAAPSATARGEEKYIVHMPLHMAQYARDLRTTSAWIKMASSSDASVNGRLDTVLAVTSCPSIVSPLRLLRIVEDAVIASNTAPGVVHDADAEGALAHRAGRNSAVVEALAAAFQLMTWVAKHTGAGGDYTALQAARLPHLAAAHDALRSAHAAVTREGVVDAHRTADARITDCRRRLEKALGDCHVQLAKAAGVHFWWVYKDGATIPRWWASATCIALGVMEATVNGVWDVKTTQLEWAAAAQRLTAQLSPSASPLKQAATATPLSPTTDALRDVMSILCQRLDLDPHVLMVGASLSPGGGMLSLAAQCRPAVHDPHQRGVGPIATIRDPGSTNRDYAVSLNVLAGGAGVLLQPLLRPSAGAVATCAQHVGNLRMCSDIPATVDDAKRHVMGKQNAGILRSHAAPARITGKSMTQLEGGNLVEEKRAQVLRCTESRRAAADDPDARASRTDRLRAAHAGVVKLQASADMPGVDLHDERSAIARGAALLLILASVLDVDTQTLRAHRWATRKKKTAAAVVAKSFLGLQGVKCEAHCKHTHDRAAACTDSPAASDASPPDYAPFDIYSALCVLPLVVDGDGMGAGRGGVQTFRTHSGVKHTSQAALEAQLSTMLVLRFRVDEMRTSTTCPSCGHYCPKSRTPVRHDGKKVENRAFNTNHCMNQHCAGARANVAATAHAGAAWAAAATHAAAAATIGGRRENLGDASAEMTLDTDAAASGMVAAAEMGAGAAGVAMDAGAVAGGTDAGNGSGGTAARQRRPRTRPARAKAAATREGRIGHNTSYNHDELGVRNISLAVHALLVAQTDVAQLLLQWVPSGIATSGDGVCGMGVRPPALSHVPMFPRSHRRGGPDSKPRGASCAH